MIQMNLKQVRILVFRFFQNELQTVDFLLNCCLFFGSFKSSLPEVSYEKGSLKDFAKFAGLCQSLFLNKVAGLRYRCFPLNLENTFFLEHLQWLLVKLLNMNEDMCVLSLTQKNICNLTGLERYNIDIIVFHHFF